MLCNHVLLLFPGCGANFAAGGAVEECDEVCWGETSYCRDDDGGVHLRGPRLGTGVRDVQCQCAKHAEGGAAGAESGGAGAVDSSGRIYVGWGWVGVSVWKAKGPGAGLGFEIQSRVAP